MSETIDIRGDAPASPYTGVGGWETEAEQGVLIMAASGLSENGPLVTIVEIGSENGMSASLFRTFAPNANLICIEIDEDANFIHNLKALGLDEPRRFHPVFTDSAKTDWPTIRRDLLKDRMVKLVIEIDLLFIDGDHSFEGALADLRNFAPYVTEGGWLILHDCACATNRLPHAQHYTVSAALQHYMAEAGDSLGFKFLFSVDTMMVWKRFS